MRDYTAPECRTIAAIDYKTMVERVIDMDNARRMLRYMEPIQMVGLAKGIDRVVNATIQR